MDELAEHLPLAKDMVDQMDHNSCLRVALSFVRMKTFMRAKGAVAKETKRNAAGGAMRPQGAGGCGTRGVQECPSEVAQELMTEVLCVCVCVCVCVRVCVCVCVCCVCMCVLWSYWCDHVILSLSGPRWVHDDDTV